MRKVVYILIGVVIVFCPISLLVQIVVCKPVHAFWRLELRADPNVHCGNGAVASYIVGGVRTVLDLIIFSLPVKHIWDIKNFSRRKKIMIISTFWFGLIACVGSILKLILYAKFAHADIMRLLSYTNDFFQTGAINVGGAKPKLYCNDYWMVKQNSETDQARDSSRNLKFREDDSKLLIKDDRRFTGLYNADGTRNSVVPFWIPDRKDYLLTELTSRTDSLCEKLDGFTVPHYGEGIVTICPHAFVVLNPNFPQAASIRRYAPIEEYLPRSGTLLHETLHLILGPKNTVGEVWAIFDFLDMARADSAKAFGNPENTVSFSLGATLSKLARTGDSLPPEYLEYSVGGG
ncbi:hypothetical protein Dda_2498 [Drechslerella dactyloides]|uniref:Rhodopsin domain-containing protein n=1 Tax=Drechslerella dactyloides TaxID=74499 RepID=A0AAD6NKT6_DREDA|nr:hypothetical protein Dda_2498 [Drechslerella dactyloides]